MIFAATWNGSQWSGFQAERQSFDPWGERRNADTWATQRSQSTDPRITSGADTHRGFTGHEMLDDFGLIHMNGRIYDPEIGRFLSCDPYVQVPEFSQNFNRYTYVLNNPLSLTDPSGLDWLGDMGAKSLNWLGRRLGPTWSDILVTVTRYVVGSFAGPVWGSTAASGLQAGLAGGSASDIRRAEAIRFVKGVAFQGVDAYVAHATDSLDIDGAIQTVGHRIVGGAVNSAIGGKFSDGFYSAAVANELGGLAKAIGGYSNPGFTAISSAVIGGTATAVGGGKFANGAISAAYEFLQWI